MIVQVDGRTAFNHYPDYPDCTCGRSSRWYSGITEEKCCLKKFTCIFCKSGTEEGSLEAIAIYGYVMGSKHLFFKESPL